MNSKTSSVCKYGNFSDNASERLLSPGRKCVEKFFLHLGKSLKSRYLTIKILCRKILKIFSRNDGNSKKITKFAVPKIGFAPRKELIFRDLFDFYF